MAEKLTVAYEQRHFNRHTGEWSDWYPSSEAAYRESLAGSVSFYEVRRASLTPDTKED